MKKQGQRPYGSVQIDSATISDDGSGQWVADVTATVNLNSDEETVGVVMLKLIDDAGMELNEIKMDFENGNYVASGVFGEDIRANKTYCLAVYVQYTLAITRQLTASAAAARTAS